MKKLFLLTLCVFALSACNAIEGSLEILKEITIVNNASDELIEFCRKHPDDYYCKDVDTENKTTILTVGHYSANLEFPESNKMKIVIFRRNQENTTLTFSLPRGVSIPEYNGEIYLRDEEVGQPYDVIGGVRTDISQSSLQRDIESCTYRTEEWVCRPDRRRDRRNCGWEPVYRTGRREVEFFYRYTTKHYTIRLNTPDTPETLVNFGGVQNFSDKIYTYQGYCR